MYVPYVCTGRNPVPILLLKSKVQISFSFSLSFFLLFDLLTYLEFFSFYQTNLHTYPSGKKLALELQQKLGTFGTP